MFTHLKKIIKRILKTDKPYYIHPTAIVNIKNISIGKGSQVWEHVIIRDHGKLVIGEHVQVGPFCVIFPGGGITISNNVLIGPHCVFAASNHNYLQTEKPMRFSDEISKGPIHVEENVWIGANCTITDGVTIGNNAVIGANSVVTKNVLPYEIVGGVPAKHISFRDSKNVQGK